MMIQEQTLERLMQCPLMTPTGPSKMETCAYALASWALRQSFDGKFKGNPEDILHEMRGKVLDLWKGERHEVGSISRTVAFRLFSLVLDYEVVHLEQPYNLVLTEYTIQGKYALLRKHIGAHLPHILILYTTEPELKNTQALPPDVTTLARYLHLYTTTEYTDAMVLHFPIFRGKPWMNKSIDLSLARKYLESMLKVASLNPFFPIRGKHCDNCATKPCLKVFEKGTNER